MSCCCEQKQESDLTLLDGVLDEYASVPGSLITILQKAQEIYGYLPQDVLRHIAQQTGVKLRRCLAWQLSTRSSVSSRWGNI